jgi:hypothetical protein
LLTKFDGKVIKRPGKEYNLMTNEGPAAVEELIKFLRN